MGAKLPSRMLGVVLATLVAVLVLGATKSGFVERFDVKPASLASEGKTPYFVLEPGYVMEYEGTEKGSAKVEARVTVLNRTMTMAGAKVRVVEDRESSNGKLVELTHDYFALDPATGNVYYFGEDVDNYENGRVTSHAGSWRAGVKGARFGLAMPGKPAVGFGAYMESAPGIGRDRFTILDVAHTASVPAGTFKNCVRVEETTPLEPGVKEYKVYAPGVGLIDDNGLRLVRYGKGKH